MADSDWVSQVIDRISTSVNGVIEVEIGGQKIVAVLGKDIVDFFKTNKTVLLRVGKDTFRSFLLLISEHKQEEAFNLLLIKMSADDIILRMEMNAQQLQQYNDDRDKFLAALEKFAKQTLLPLTIKVLIGLLL